MLRTDITTAINIDICEGCTQQIMKSIKLAQYMFYGTYYGC